MDRTRRQLRLGIIGTGEIAAALVDGLGRAAQRADGPRAGHGLAAVLSPRGARTAAALAARHPFARVAASNQAVVDDCDVLLLSVVPDAAREALTGLTVPAERVVISAIAATPLERIREWTGTGAALVRSIPMPAVRTGQGLTAVFPDHPAARGLFERVGTVLALPDEAAFATLSTASAALSTHFHFLSALADWLTRAGIEDRVAQGYVRGLFAGAAPALSADVPLSDIAGSHETPGGLNEQLREHWFDAPNRAALDAALNDVHRRVQGG
ncbi:NAD(P)-binding domain-containing protein [Brevibacterium sp. 5221]|uniref:NAD(P)-binding domain-containing protein n=1 Tax=Brevibacterium rongguiense TaxID=2695267 RepID=A0A6N9H9A1_9MICO|nr:NAD(P)-binding domain-containing protein [Brevibacterium rongguiense]MYM20593.1 NAD(P)-binding domain-containing protein [Brevibacterium rongguiense]